MDLKCVALHLTVWRLLQNPSILYKCTSLVNVQIQYVSIPKWYFLYKHIEIFHLYLHSHVQIFSLCSLSRLFNLQDVACAHTGRGTQKQTCKGCFLKIKLSELQTFVNLATIYNTISVFQMDDLLQSLNVR